jgi:acyl-CoA hydrolase
MVAVDAQGKPVGVPPIELITDEQRARHAKAEERKKSRQALHGKAR